MKNLIIKAKEALPSEYKARPWTCPGLEHGTGILKTDLQLNAYTAAYGEMHQIKCRAAFQNFPFDQFQGTIQIVDWGCGQGFGSYCAIMTLEERNLSQWVKRVTLIEPSKAALERAVSNINSMTRGRVNILDLQMYCPGNGTFDEIESIDYTCDNVIHIFSNILDVKTVNIQKLAKICATSQRKVFMMCISPMNSNSYRIDRFHSIFGSPECFSQISDFEYERTSDTHHLVSCKTKCFMYDGSPLQPEDVHSIPEPDFCGSRPIFDDYDILYSGYDSSSANLLQQLYETLSLQINPMEDFLIVRPNIDGDIVDLMVLRPSMGILIIKVFDKSLCSFKYCIRQKKNGEPVLDENGNTQIDKFNLVDMNTGEIIISPIVSLGSYQKKFLTSKTEELLKQVIADDKTFSLIKKMVLFTKDDTAYAREFFKGNFDFTNIYGRDFLSQPNFKDGFLNSVIFKYSCRAFTTSILSSFLRIISPDWHSRKEGKYIKLNAIQKKLAKSEPNKTQKISGVAGSGKTLVLATRCINAQKRTGGDVLVLTYNKTLANYIKHRINEIREDFPWSKIHISHYHKFFRQHAHQCNKHVHLSSYEDREFFSDTNRQNSFLKYDAIFVDEVQDYKTEWLQILQKEFMKEGGEFVVFGDPKQNVYGNDLDQNGDIRLGVIRAPWNHELKNSKRYHNLQLLNIFNRFQLTFFANPELTEADTSDSLTLFSCIEYRNLHLTDSIDPLYTCVKDILRCHNSDISGVSILAHGNDILRELADKFEDIDRSTFSTTFCTQKDIEQLRRKTYHYQSQYLSDVESIDQIKKYNFTMDSPGFKMSTIDSFKGWESPVVILIIQKEGSSQEKYSVPPRMMTPEVVYTGITRATESLYIINLNNRIYDNFFNHN